MRENISHMIRLVDRALDWLQANLDSFEPFQGKNRADEFKQKALVELALLCMYLQQRSPFVSDVRVQELLCFISRVYNTPYFREGMFRVEDVFVAHALLVVVLRVCGLLDNDEERLAIQELIDRSNVTLVERLPYRMLELRHILDLGQFKHRLPSYETLYRNTLLAKPLNLIYITDADAYSITHTLFYLSDFGAHPISALSPAQKKRAGWIVEHLLGMYTHSGNWDMVAELLLSCYCLRRTASSLYMLGWQALLGAQRSDGVIPGPYYNSQEAEQLEAQKKLQYVFEQCYHTTLVATLASALCTNSVENYET